MKECIDISNIQYINANNDIIIPNNGYNYKITTIPIPFIEIKKRNKANFVNKNYYAILKNKFNIPLNNDYKYIITLNIVLIKCFGDYEIISNTFTNMDFTLYIIYNNGTSKNYTATSYINTSNTLIHITANFIIDQNFNNVEGFKYEINNNNKFILNRKCYNSRKKCVSYIYFGYAYISLTTFFP